MLLLSGDGVDDVALAIGAGVIDVVAPVPAFPIWRRWCHPCGIFSEVFSSE